MIYAVNKRTKEHRVCLPENSDNFLREAFVFTTDEKLIQATPDGWIEWQGESHESPMPPESECRIRLSDGTKFTVIDPEDWDWSKVGDHWIVAYRPIIDADTKPEPPAWDGEGVPAAGTQVDCKDEKTPMWTRCQVVFSSDYVVVVEAIDGLGEGAQVALDVLGKDGLGRLRPIRSEEDRAVVEMAKAAEEGLGHASGLIECMTAASGIYCAIRDGRVPGITLEETS